MITLPELLDTNKCKDFLYVQQKRIQSPNLKVTASMIMKKYARTYLDHCFDSMLWESEIKIIPLSACRIREDLELEIDPKHVSQTISRSRSWENVFAQHITPIVLALHQTTKLPLRILWENVSVRINSYFRKALQNHPDYEDRILELCKELHELNHTYFNWNSHPLIHYLAPLTSIKKQKIRSTCCFYYKLEKEKELSHCLVCPIKNPNKVN